MKAKRARKDSELAEESVKRDVFGNDEETMAFYDVVKTVLYGRTRITILQPKIN